MIYLIIPSIIWAFSYGLIKGNLTGLSPDFIACIRMGLPLILFLPFFKYKILSLKKALSFLGIGAIQYGLMYLLCIRAYEYLPAYQVVLFTAFTPIYVTLLNDLFSKSFTVAYLLAASISLLGIAFLHYNTLTWQVTYKGFFLVQLSDLCFGFGQIAYKHLMKQEPQVKDKEIYALLFLGAFIITALSTTLFHGWGSLYSTSLKQSMLLLYLGFIASGVCFFFWNKAGTKVNTGTLAVFNNLKIPLGVLVSLLFFHEKANILSLTLSCALITAAVIFTERHHRKSYKLTIHRASK